MGLHIHIDEPKGDSRRVALSGRLDTHTYGELDRRLEPVLASDLRALVLDLADLEYISSAGIRSVFKARKAIEGRGGRVLVTNLQPQIKKVFDIVKAVPLNSIFTSVEEADRYLDAMQKRVLEEEDRP
ncbi:STAS domain-containing protein [Vulcaniibacterium tengchongense]|uniref:Anti-sigma factor antagonist n=1 Tax=Vulcaniibacterium tengchongense TaxID=1273429 RepID=A0A3N4W884_9GAMM|nr:STAS domain-containing protein [Vulcaniibacterium tengchongense]RPE81434.1 anti-anti-sigma factor [Vulcaniibacterium tengchongense]